MRYLALLLCIVSSSCSNERQAAVPDETNGATAESDGNVDTTARQSDSTSDTERRNSANYLAADNSTGRGASEDSYGADRMSPSATTNQDGASTTGTNTAATSGVTPSGVGQTEATNPSASDTAPAGTPADNTKKNKRDQNDANLTPMDQGTSEADRRITQDIRKAVVANDMLSFTAKNVKIITRDGRVTLRGPVKSEEERKAIEASARKVAGDTNVDNQLEIAN